jgi:uncharacterized membrane protein YkvA (DUF1232 family)
VAGEDAGWSGSGLCPYVSTIDLIPDFIPVVGHLDDLVIVPLGILAVEALQALGRDPTPEEWEGIDRRIHDRLVSIRATMGAAALPPEPQPVSG